MFYYKRLGHTALLVIFFGINLSTNAQISETAKQKNQIAEKAWLAGEKNESIQLYFESIRYSPKQVLPYQRIAEFFEEKGLYEKALTYLNDGIIQNPVAELYIKRASIHSSMKNYSLAKSDEEKLISLKRNTPIHYYNAAIYSHYLKEPNPLRYFDEADKISAIDPLEIWLYRGLYFAAGPMDYKNAKIWFDKIFTKGQHPAYTSNDLNLMGITAYKNKEYNNAETLLKGSLERKEDPDVMGNLASVYIDLQDWKKLIELSKRMIERYPDHIMSNGYHGFALIKNGKTNEGNQYLKKAELLEKQKQ